MGFGFENPRRNVPRNPDEKISPAFDQGRRDFLSLAGKTLLVGAAVGLGADRFLRNSSESKPERKEEPVVENEFTENPAEEIFSYEGVKHIGEKEFKSLVGYWIRQYSEGDFAKDFQDAVGELRRHWHMVSHEFDNECVPRELALVSLYESFWHRESWGESGPFQVSKTITDHYNEEHHAHADRSTPRGSTWVAAKLFADILREVGNDDRFSVLRYNASYFRQYVRHLEEEGNGSEPSVNGFLEFMSGRAEDIRKKIVTAHGMSGKGKRLFDDIGSGIAGIRINVEYLAKFEAVKKIFREDNGLADLLGPGSKNIS